MASKTNEQALEAAIQKHLTGTCLEEFSTSVAEESVVYGGSLLYDIGYANDFNAKYAIDEVKF